jgi:hypothetical protein
VTAAFRSHSNPQQVLFIIKNNIERTAIAYCWRGSNLSGELMQRGSPMKKSIDGAQAVCAVLALGAMLASCGARETASAAPEARLGPPPVTAVNLFVAPGGADSNAGTAAAPFRTIARAAQAALPGTTVHVAPGTYPGGFRTAASGSASGRIYFVSTLRWGAKIVPAANSAAATAWDNRGNYVDIDGFDVDGSVSQGGTKWSNGIYNGGSYDVIRNNHVHHIAATDSCAGAASGIGIDSYYHGVQSGVIGNMVHDIGSPGCRDVQGIYINTPGTVKNNVVYRIAETGIQLWHDANNVIIANNTVAASGMGIVVGGGDYYYTSGPNDRTQVSNNIVYDNKNGISEQGRTGKNNSYRNNLVFQNTAGDWSLANGLRPSATITAEPQFLAYNKSGTPDFRLRSGSPAIGKGTAINAPASDFRGYPRSIGTGYDIGAYQH